MKNTTETKHTPTPWKYHDATKTIRAVPAHYWIASMNIFDGAVNNKANAEFIVRAVNLHETLLEAAKDALCELDPDCNYDGSNYQPKPDDEGDSRIQIILALYKVIDQAEGK